MPGLRTPLFASLRVDPAQAPWPRRPHINEPTRGRTT